MPRLSKLLLCVVLGLSACSESGTYSLQLIFPDEQSFQNTREVVLWAAEPSGSDCASIIDGAIDPNSLSVQSMRVFQISSDQQALFQDVPAGEILFIAEGSDIASVAFLRACELVQVKGGASVQVTLMLERVCTPEPGGEIAGNGKDDDCDGLIDECAGDADCDDDKDCTEDSCIEGICHNQASSETDTTCDGIDDDCDGYFDNDYLIDDTCGTGFCNTTNQSSSCIGGVETPCQPGTPYGPDDATCNNIDTDCDGATDDDYLAISNCGVGYCETNNIPSSCSAGVETACQPEAPLSEEDATCDGIDDDCDGGTDEEYRADSSCGVSYCQTTSTPSSCSAGVETACQPGTPLSASDATCDGLDDDCDGATDDDYLANSSCGVGYCKDTNTPSACTAGVETACQSGTPLSASDVTCDGIDDDCDGATDEDYVADASCGVGYCAGSRTPSSCAGGIETACQPGTALSASDETCDGVDDDCSGSADEDYPITPSTCGNGVCVASGQLECQAGLEIDTCTPGSPSETPEVSCADGLDNDCDGFEDDADSGCIASCHDLDGDNYGDPGDPSCPGGPQLDCDDSDPLTNPGQTDASCNGVDNDCDTLTDEEYLADSACGVGHCLTNNTASSCSAGVETACEPGTPLSATDTTCDGIDDDCDGGADEEYAADSSCGVGYCQTTNTASSCSAGVETACQPGTALSATDASCDGLDDDCDGAADDDYPADASCGVGYCQDTNVPSTCSDGVETACQSGTALSATDVTCDGVDDDCDGGSDEEYSADSNCGTGYCQTTNTPSSCSAGTETACQPGSPLGATDASCDGVDDDCDGDADDDYSPDASCGVGYCQTTNTPSSCDAGVETSCQPGTPLGATDPSCDGIDDDCDGGADVEYPVSASSCGTGVCQAGGQLECQSGNEVDTCTPGSPSETPEVSCADGNDNDCDSYVDMGDSDCVSTCTDGDSDSYGDPGDPSCAGGPQQDCNDSDAGIHPGATEICDDVDQDCDGNFDEGSCGVGLTCIEGSCVGFSRLTGGRYHSCELSAGGVASCWGQDDFGQLGNGGTSVDSQLPVAVDASAIGNPVFTQLAGGDYHSCGVTAAGTASCWGQDDYDQLGDGGSRVDSQVPVAVDASAVGNPSFAQLTAGARHSCGLTTVGVAYCWGDDALGQLGTGGSSQDSAVPVAVDTSAIGNPSFAQLTTGQFHTCGLTTTGVAYCWGYDYKGQLGDGGARNDSQEPVAVDTSGIGNATFTQLSAGTWHTCGLTTEGLATCWGYNDYGQLGNGTDVDSQSPLWVNTDAIGNPSFAHLSAGEGHVCGLTTAGLVYCWGNDAYGQLGDGAGSQDSCGPWACSVLAVAVDASAIGNPTFSELYAGGWHTCAVSTEGATICWGRDDCGQLGDGGTSVNSPVPVAVVAN